MFEIEIDRSFSAAHQLRGYNGDCCKLHGHNYKITVTVRSSELDEIGIALDFKKLKAEDVSEDEIKELEEQAQKLTDRFIKEIDQTVEAKSKEILTV